MQRSPDKIPLQCPVIDPATQQRCRFFVNKSANYQKANNPPANPEPTATSQPPMYHMFPSMQPPTPTPATTSQVEGSLCRLGCGERGNVVCEHKACARCCRDNPTSTCSVRLHAKHHSQQAPSSRPVSPPPAYPTQPPSTAPSASQLPVAVAPPRPASYVTNTAPPPPINALPNPHHASHMFPIFTEQNVTEEEMREKKRLADEARVKAISATRNVAEVYAWNGVCIVASLACVHVN